MSDDGRVRSKKNPLRCLRQARFSGGYLGVGLRANGRGKSWKVHQLVLLAFVGPRPAGPPRYAAAHFDGNRDNNSASNLRWATYEENAEDKVRHGKDPRGERSGNCRYSDATVAEMRRRAASGERPTDIASSFGVSRGYVTNVVKRRSRAYSA